jgi:hypothetical protein
MKKLTSHGFKGFGTQPSLSSNKHIQQLLKQVDRQTKMNQATPGALENFTKLVNEGNMEKLAEYFKQYGIHPDITRLNPIPLIAEELRDLSR